jgi:5'-3' exonuclease
MKRWKGCSVAKTWLVLDVYNLAYRAFYTSGHLSHGGNPTGTLYGMFRDLIKLQDDFGTHLCAFAFDLGKGKREQEFPWYKANRRRQGEKILMEGISEMKQQVERLRRVYLERLGYPNVLYQDGYEADDIIASVCDCLPINDEVVIVSADEDMFQLLRKNRVCVYSPKTKKVWTKENFTNEYGIKPIQWPVVKALAGCSSDNIKGMKGIGEKTAIKWIRGETIRQESEILEFVKTKEFNDYLHCVCIPYPETNPFDLIDHPPPTREAWSNLMESLGMTTLANHDPSGVTRQLFAGR